jgi:hypothetical protein
VGINSSDKNQFARTGAGPVVSRNADYAGPSTSYRDQMTSDTGAIRPMRRPTGEPNVRLPDSGNPKSHELMANINAARTTILKTYDHSP